MSFLDDDINEFFHDFKTEVTITSSSGSTTGTTSTFCAIFDESQEVYSIETGQVISASPTITCKTTDVSALNKGDSLSINSVTYYIKSILEDGTGITVLRLSTNS